jgi:flagellar biosynthesis protein FlhF
MEIQTFTGATLVDALIQVKRQLGEDAVILTSRRAEDPARLPEGHLVEVVAALPQAPRRPGRPSTRTGEARAWQPPRLERSGAATPTLAVAAEPAQVAETRPLPAGELDELRQELAALRRAILDPAATQHQDRRAAWSPGHEQALRTLCGRGVARPAACALLDELAGLDASKVEAALVPALARRLPCAPLEESTPGRRVEALVGPTGVGKTTALAKWVLRRDAGHRRAGILSLDTKRVAAVEQIRRLASILKAPLETVYRPAELSAALERLSACDLVLVDTPGTGPRERLGLERIRAFLRELGPVHVHLVLPASMRLEDQLANLHPWKAAGADRLLVTKLDEAAALGGLVELATQAGLPFSWVGTGSRIPGDLARAAGRTLARWILRPDEVGGEEREDAPAQLGLKRLQSLVAEARAAL